MSNELEISKDGCSLSYKVWVKRGDRLFNRDMLPHDDPDQTYNFLKRHGVQPEKFSIYDPRVEMIQEKYDGVTREELIRRILDLEAEINSLEKYLS